MEKAPHGRLTLIIGPMFSGKTTKFIEYATKAILNPDKKAFIYKPKRDNRYSENAIVSHSGIEINITKNIECIPRDINVEPYAPPATYLFDEVQFLGKPFVEIVDSFPFPTIVSVLLDQGHDVVCAGLLRGADGHIFDITHQLQGMADEVIEMRGTCYVCDSRSTETQRLPETGEQPERYDIGGKDKYQPVCSKHFTPVTINN